MCTRSACEIDRMKRETMNSLTREPAVGLDLPEGYAARRDAINSQWDAQNNNSNNTSVALCLFHYQEG